MAQIFKNNTWGQLASQLTAGATTATLTAGHNFTDPGTDWYLATLIGVTGTTETSWEIVKVTDVSTNTLTIVRAQEGTTDATWPAGTRIELRLTAGATESKANLGTAAYTASTDYAVAAKGVTNGDSHNHSGVDGAQIAYSSLSGTPTLPSGAIVGTTDQQTLSAKTLTGLKETKVAVSAAEINLATGNWFTKTISTTTAFTVTNVPSSGTAVSFILDLTNGGSATVSWSTGFTSVKYAGGSAPTLTASGRDVLGFFTHDGGSTWTCLLLVKDVK